MDKRPVTIAQDMPRNLSKQEQRIVNYHQKSIDEGKVGRDEQGRPITVYALGVRIPKGEPHAGKFVSLPGWVNGRILSEGEAYEHWKSEIKDGKWPLYDSGERLNKRAAEIHKIMDADADAMRMER